MTRFIVFLTGFLVIIIATLGLGMQTDILPGTLIIGGEYSLPSGQNPGTLTALFARVTVPDDAIVNGRIFSFSSDISVRGTVTNGIRALESDIILRETGQVTGDVSQKDILHWILLLPSLVQIS